MILRGRCWTYFRTALCTWGSDNGSPTDQSTPGKAKSAVRVYFASCWDGSRVATLQPDATCETLKPGTAMVRCTNKPPMAVPCMTVEPLLVRSTCGWPFLPSFSWSLVKLVTDV